MPNSDHRDRFFYQYLTLIQDSYIYTIQPENFVNTLKCFVDQRATCRSSELNGKSMLESCYSQNTGYIMEVKIYH